MSKLTKLFLLLATMAFATQPILTHAADGASSDQKKADEEPECDD